MARVLVLTMRVRLELITVEKDKKIGNDDGMQWRRVLTVSLGMRYQSMSRSLQSSCLLGHQTLADV